MNIYIDIYIYIYNIYIYIYIYIHNFMYNYIYIYIYIFFKAFSPNQRSTISAVPEDADSKILQFTIAKFNPPGHS